MGAAREFGQAGFAAALVGSSTACPDGLATWNGSDPAARFAVHRRNVIGSLVSALAETYPVVRQLVGDEFFRAMAARAVQRTPPRSRVLGHYGEHFAGFIETFEPARGLPYLADVARLEWARVRASQAADAQALPAPTLHRGLMALSARFDEARLEMHPSVSVLHSRHAVLSIWAAHHGQGVLAEVEVDRPQSVWVWRDGLEVVGEEIERGAAVFIDALLRGATLAAAAGAAAEEDGFDLAAALRLLIGQGVVTAVRSADATS